MREETSKVGRKGEASLLEGGRRHSYTSQELEWLHLSAMEQILLWNYFTETLPHPLSGVERRHRFTLRTHYEHGQPWWGEKAPEF